MRPRATRIWPGSSAQAAAFDVEVKERPEFAMIAVQGPNARAKVVGLLHEGDRPRIEKLGKFAAAAAQGPHGMPLFVARTGYTGEDGFEIIVPQEHAVALWNALLAAGVKPAGLGARDTLRLEAGMNLYGQDMDEDVSPWEANLGWTIALDEGRDFIGRAALEQQKADGVPAGDGRPGAGREGRAAPRPEGADRRTARARSCPAALRRRWTRRWRSRGSRPASRATCAWTSAVARCRCAW